MPPKSGNYDCKSETGSAMINSLYTEMGFDDWCELASNDPDAFEAARSAVIEEFLSSVPSHARKRMRGLQWRIDTIRERSGNPMAACLDIYAMMWDKLAGENGMIETLQSFEKPYLLYKTPPSAQILNFRPQPHKPK